MNEYIQPTLTVSQTQALIKAALGFRVPDPIDLAMGIACLSSELNDFAGPRLASVPDTGA